MIYSTDDVSISGFKGAVSEQIAMESANEAVVRKEQEGGASPDSASAASQSIDEPTKDLVSSSLPDQPGIHQVVNAFIHTSYV